MTPPVTSLLRTIWETPVFQTEVVSTFEGWVLQGISRTEAKDKMKTLLEVHVASQPTNSRSELDLEKVDWDQFVEFLCQCFYRNRFRMPLPDIPSDDVWRQLTNRQTWGILSFHPQQEKAIKETVPVPLIPLEKKLLTHGGRRMVYRLEPDLQLLLERGELFEEGADLVMGEPGQCHLNVALLWSEQREALAIVTGYALSEDGLWRQHSWLFRQNPDTDEARLIETTIRRVKYFGVMLTEAEADRFVQNNE